MTAIEAHEDQSMEIFHEAQKHFEEIVDHLRSEEAWGMTHSEVEGLLHAEGFELLRLLYQGYLDNLGDGTAGGEVRNAQGVELNHNVQNERYLTTLFGKVQLYRRGYRNRDCSALYPLDAQLNMPVHQQSFGVERRVVEEAVQVSFNETVKSVDRTTGAHVAKRQVEEIVVRASEDFDSFYREVEYAADEATGPFVILSADGKGIVMRKEDLRERTRKAAEQREHKLSTRLSKGEKRNAKRLAEVATVYTIEPHIRKAEDVLRKLRPVGKKKSKPPKPEHKRVWASVEKEPEDVLREAFEEGLRRDPDRTKKWVALVDGNKGQLRLLKKLAKEYKIKLTIVVDFIHALEYLWKAAHAIVGDGKDAEEWVHERGLRLLKGEASLVAAGIRRSATRRGIKGKARKKVDTCANYLLNNAKHMKYDVCLKRGCPIATGVVEGACRHLVKDRMDLTGARWGLKRAEAVLRLRALYASGDLDAYWEYHEHNEHQRNHATRYYRSSPTKPLLSGKRHHLRVVK